VLFFFGSDFKQADSRITNDCQKKKRKDKENSFSKLTAWSLVTKAINCLISKTLWLNKYPGSRYLESRKVPV